MEIKDEAEEARETRTNEENHLDPLEDQLAPVASQSRIHAYAKQVTCPPDLSNVGAVNITASNKDSSSSQIVHAILSQREVLSKQASFNSPNSLHKKLQLTGEKI